MRDRVSVLLCCLLAACAAPQGRQAPSASLFRDQSFDAPQERFDASGLFAVDDSMRRFLQKDIAREIRLEGPVNGLIQALYREGALKLRYDASRTRSASEAFEARAGNCLSLVIMTAAFAKELGLQLEYNGAEIGEMWGRNGGLLVGSGHVNVTLGPGRPQIFTRVYQPSQTVDFLPESEISGLRFRRISERTVVAMYMNNRSVEALVQQNLDDAYGWARAAIRLDPDFGSSYNTLAIVYLRHGDAEQAASVLRYELQREPDDTTLLSNLADLASRLGNKAEAAALRTRLAQIDPNPPYYFFDLGMQAMQRNDFQSARTLFGREVARAGYNHEFHFWLGVAYFKLGETERARQQLLLALENSPTPNDQHLYAAKLAWLQANAGAGRTQPAGPPGAPVR